MPDNRVIQNKVVGSLVRALDMKLVLAPHSDEPLARFTITRFAKLGSTAIGFSQYHPIGTIQATPLLGFRSIIDEVIQVMATQ